MSVVEDMVSELESIGAIGNKVTVLKPKLVREVPEESEEADYEPPPMAEEAPEEPEEADLSEAEIREAQLREKLSALAQKADEKLAKVIEAVQDLRGVFQELNEATTGERHEEIPEETGTEPRHHSGVREAEAGPDSGG